MTKETKRHCTVFATQDLVDKFDKLPITRSRAMNLAIGYAGKDPELLVQALRFRLSQPHVENSVKVSYSRDIKLEGALETLTHMTKLPAEQVIRLAMEAYINRL